jgi:poly(A) polymerase
VNTDERVPFARPLPPAAAPAVEIVRALQAAGHQALLAGGCVRDLLRGAEPADYDVATSAGPDAVCGLFPRTRRVGVQFGVVLVRRQRRWVEVATFRTDGRYADGRRPESVTFARDARTDALRRDFTINGMFLDPLAGVVLDYVAGRADLAARRVRAIGDPATRFGEDYLRLLRAVRFAARLDFALEPATLAAMRACAPRLRAVAAERVLDELERMLGHANRAGAWRLLDEAGLLPHLVAGVEWSPAQAAGVTEALARLPADAPFELALAVAAAAFTPAQVQELCRGLTCSNDQRATVAWLVAHQSDLDEPDAPTLAALKRLLACPAFALLETLAGVRYAALADGAARAAALRQRVRAINPAAVAPPPLVTGDDLAALGVPPGPCYRDVLEQVYTAQLDERLVSREEALALAAQLLGVDRPS